MDQPLTCRALKQGQCQRESISIHDSLENHVPVHSLRYHLPVHSLRYVSREIRTHERRIRKQEKGGKLYVMVEKEEKNVFPFSWYTTSDASDLESSTDKRKRNLCSRDQALARTVNTNEHAGRARVMRLSHQLPRRGTAAKSRPHSQKPRCGITTCFFPPHTFSISFPPLTKSTVVYLLTFFFF